MQSHITLTNTNLPRAEPLHRATLAHARRQLAAAAALLAAGNREGNAGVRQMMVDRRQCRLQFRIAPAQRRDPAAVRLAGRRRRRGRRRRMMVAVAGGAARAWLCGWVVVE